MKGKTPGHRERHFYPYLYGFDNVDMSRDDARGDSETGRGLALSQGVRSRLALTSDMWRRGRGFRSVKGAKRKGRPKGLSGGSSFLSRYFYAETRNELWTDSRRTTHSPRRDSGPTVTIYSVYPLHLECQITLYVCLASICCACLFS